MAGKRKGLSVRKLKEMLRLSLECGLEGREVARSLSVSHTTVNDYLGRVRELGLSYAQAEEMGEEELRRLLKGEDSLGFSRSPGSERDKPQPDWEGVHRELKRKGVTLQLLCNKGSALEIEGESRYDDGKLRERHHEGQKLWLDRCGLSTRGHFIM